MVTTHIHNQYSARTRCHSPSVPDLHTSPPAPALSTSSSQFIIQLWTIRFYLQASGTLRVLSFLFLLITDTATLVHGVILPILNSVVKTFGVKPFPPGEARCKIMYLIFVYYYFLYLILFHNAALNSGRVRGTKLILFRIGNLHCSAHDQ